MRTRIEGWLLVGILTLFAFQPFLPGFAAAQSDRPGPEDKLREAVVRYQIANWDLKAKVYFVQINDKDPSPEFLARFKDIPRPVKEQSQSRQQEKVDGWVVDKKNKKMGRDLP